MPELALGRGEWVRERGAFPPWRQENCFLEETKTDPKGYNILSRPPLVQYTTKGAGPINGTFQRAGLFAGDKFYVSGNNLYREGANLGAIDGSGPVIWAAGNGELLLTRGTSAWSYNGIDLVAVAFPDGANVSSVHWMGRLFVYVRAGSGRMYWSALDDGRTVDGLNYLTAESEPDELYDIAKMGDVFGLLGANSIETWILNGDPDLPWTRISQRSFGRGVRGPGCKAEIADANTFYFISSDAMVCRMADSPQRVSDGALDEKISASVSALAFGYQYEGKPYFCMRLDSGTYILDIAAGDMPVRFSTAGRSKWAPKCAMTVLGVPYFGDDTGNQIWIFQEGATTDCGAVEMARYFSAGLPLGSNARIMNVLVSGNNGSATVETGESAVPKLEMRISRDGGKTFDAWRATEWGRMGENRRRARFGACGMHGPPGFLAEFRMLECAPLRVERAGFNETAAGRGR